MLVLWRRHTKACPHDSREALKCRCPIWIDWRVSGKRVRKPLHIRDWQAAQIRARQLEADGIVSELVPQTLEQVTKKFLEDAKARGLRDSSIYKYRLVLQQLEAFAKDRGLVFLSSFGVDELRAFRASWNNKNLSARKKLEHLKAFFRFVHDSGWIKDNPAKLIKPPKVSDPAILPFSDEEMVRILKACGTHPNPQRAIQLRGLVLLMRHSGLRIGDAVQLKRESIDHGVLELSTEKSGTKVRLPLNPEAVAALGKIPKTGAHFFWNGESKRRTIIGTWERTIAWLFKRAGVPGHSHQFRHSFAAGLLQRGVSLENVSMLLGHRDVRITQRHYSAWIAGRQKHLDDEVRRTW